MLRQLHKYRPKLNIDAQAMPGGRPRRDPVADAERSRRERERKQTKYKCNCTYPDCSGMVSQQTLLRHSEWMAAQAQIAANLAGIRDLQSGYPAPELLAGLDVRDDEGDDSVADVGDVAGGEAGGEGDVEFEHAAEIGPLQARSTHRTPQLSR